MGILADDVARVREATDIVQLISTTVALRKAGRRWQGLCPFHTEKTPSFSVNAEEGLYYCFGCRASGDAITFVRQTEGLDFAASVEMLAARANITLRYDSKGEAAQSGRRKKLTEVVAAAVEWYHERLLRHPDASGARGYLRSRGISGDEVRAFKVGWAPGGWDVLTRALGSKAPTSDLREAGLSVVSSRGDLIDNFHSRVLFPVFDVRGDPVGFGGRILPGADGPSGPKYKNTPESPLYTKSRLLYGLNWAKESIVRAGEVIVCEGYTDVIGLHAAGLPHAVATCGTSLTEDHVKVMRRFCVRIVLAFDADAAGSTAPERIYQWEKAHGLDIFVARLPPGADPDDLARIDPEGLRDYVRDAVPFLEYRIDRALGRANPTLEESRVRVNDVAWHVAWANLLRPLTPELRVRAAEAAMTVVDEHPTRLVRDEFLMLVADACHLPSDRLRETVAQSRTKARDGRRPSDGPAEPSIEEQILLLRMHAPDNLPSWIGVGLFADELHGRLFALLARGTPLRDLTEVATGDAAAVLARLSVCEPPDHAAHVVARFVFDAAGPWIDDVTRTARTTGDASLGRHLGEVQRACEELRAENWSLAVAERLARLLDEAATGADLAAGSEERTGPPPLDRVGEDLAPQEEPAGDPPPRGDAQPFDQAPAASEEERFYEDLPSHETEEEYVTNLPGAGEAHR